MALFKILKGNESSLPTTKTEGYAYFCKDTGAFYIDTSSSERKQLTCQALSKNGEIKSFENIATMANINASKTQMIEVTIPSSAWPVDSTSTTWTDEDLNVLRCTISPLILCHPEVDTAGKNLYNNIQNISVTPATDEADGSLTITLKSNITKANMTLIILDFG